MSKHCEQLEVFVEKSKMTGRGALCVGLVVTRHAKNFGLPLDDAKLLAPSGGQVLGLGKGAVQSILKDHGISKVLAEEGGRTSRGSIGNMQSYVKFLNGIAPLGNSDLDYIEDWWIERVKKFLETKPMVFRLDMNSSLRTAIRDILHQVEVLQKQGAGTMVVGAVMQHLVGAKLELVLGDKIESHGAFVSDSVTDRPGDYLVGDVAVHVTTSPGEALIRKCNENIQNGIHPLIITTFRNVPVAETLAENAGISDRIEVFDVEQFLASNILEMSRFKTSSRRVKIADLVKIYNRLAKSENNPGLLIRTK